MIEFCPSKFELQFLKITVVISFFFVVLLPKGDTSDSVPFADMIPQIHFCYLNCHTDTFNQLLHLRVSRLRSSLVTTHVPNVTYEWNSAISKQTEFRQLRVLIPIISIHYKLQTSYMWPTATSRSVLTISQGRDQTSVL